MKKRLIFGAVCCAWTIMGTSLAWAGFEPTVETAYNTAVQGQDSLDGLDVTVKEKTVSSNTNIASSKTVDLQLSGIKNSSLQADIKASTNEESDESYYRGDYYYTTTSEGKIKRKLDRTKLWNLVNSHIYLDMTSNYLKMLYSEQGSDGSVIYRFAATNDTLGEYTKKLLNGIGEDESVIVDALIGTMKTDKNGHVTERAIQMFYTVNSGNSSETFLVETNAEFHQNGEAVTVSLPDLSEYKELKADTPEETITPIQRTVYVTADVNVRAAGDINAAILGGFVAGSGATQTGYTSDGWIQVQYNENTGYIWGDYVSLTKPIFTKNSTGVMYATTSLNVRASYSSDSALLGTLSKGDSVTITGTTTNGWTRVLYQGNTGYVFSDYLSWTQPVSSTFVKNGFISGTVTDASYGSLTVQRNDGGGTIMFSTIYASMDLQDTLCTGDYVEVYYSGSGIPYAASQINDYTNHEDHSGTARSVSCDGIVTSLNGTKLDVSCTDGIIRSFDISDADIEMPYELCSGMYVTVYWMSSNGGNETKNITALRVMG